MNIVFESRESSFTAPYLNLLLLRDNVQHYLQDGRPELGYVLIHALAESGFPVQEGPLASDLWEEVSMACSGLVGIPIEQLAISIRTRGLITGVKSIPPVHGTMVARDVDWAVPIATDGKTTLGELFGDIREGIGGVTRFGAADGRLRILRSSDTAT